MKQYLKVAVVLTLIASICAVLIALLNLVTAPIIEKNAYEKEQNTLSVMFSNAEFTEVDHNENYQEIEKKFVAKSKNDQTELGYVYIVSGKNAYGMVRLMVGVKDGKTVKVEIMDNTESFKKNVNTFIDEKIKSSELSIEDAEKLDVKCGATYGAKLVQSLIKIVLEEGGDK